MEWLFGHQWTDGWAALSPGLFALGGAAIGLWGTSRNSKRQLDHAKQQWGLDFDERLAQRMREVYPDLVQFSTSVNQAAAVLYTANDVLASQEAGYDLGAAESERSSAMTRLLETTTEGIRITETVRLLSKNKVIDQQVQEIQRLLNIVTYEAASSTVCSILEKRVEWIKDSSLRAATKGLHTCVVRLAVIMKETLNNPALPPPRKRSRKESVKAPEFELSEVGPVEKWKKYSDEAKLYSLSDPAAMRPAGTELPTS